MLRQMRAREVELPEWLGLTPGCVALLNRLLEPEPGKRATVADVMEDAWFRVDLPPNALGMNDKYLALPPAAEQTEAEIEAVVAALFAAADGRGNGGGGAQ
jgi:anti-sigma factor RsiW